MFKERLKELRKEFNMTQKQLGEKLNLTNATIGMYESGVRNPEIKTMITLADLFNVSADYLLGFSDFRQTPEQILNGPAKVYIMTREINDLPEEAIEKVDEYIKIIKTTYKSKKEK
jgi:transcriptional regulator with XRE-family HTH domain